MQEKSNQIFQLDWECDLQHIPEPTAYLLKDQFSDPTSERDYRKYPLVQADPTDRICFSKSVLGKCEHRSNKLIWMSTLDRYLRQYYLLARQREEIEGDHIRMRKILVPYQVHEEYLDYLSRRNKNPICYDIRLFEQAKGETTEDEKYLFYNAPRFACGSFLNHICRSIYTRKNADNNRYSLFSDGLKFELYGIEDFIPSFELVDYFEHEMTTGVSLSIEIASVLLEFEDDELRHSAWSAFCDKVLPRIIHSQLFFTRNTIARNFFQQILMEKKINDYRWYPEGAETDAKGMLNRALSHTDLIWSNPEQLYYKSSEKKEKLTVPRGNIYPSRIEVPDGQIDDALKHLWSLLSIVTQPFDLCYRGDTNANRVYENKHLAVFCNPEHNHVKRYLDELVNAVNSRDGMKNLEEGKKYSTPRKRDREHSMFRMVHSTVRKMI